MEEGPPILVERNLRIPMRDGVALVADLYSPHGKGPFPLLVSAYPYHKDDYIGVMCASPCRFFATHGYASLVVDCRGTGGSEGLPLEPFDRREREDGVDVVEWAAAQPWCDGRVGMWGISYGAVTALETASERPPHLRAIVAEYACSDPYQDFIYPGGCLNCLSAYGSWGSLMLAMNLMPPTLADPEGRWYRVWTERLGESQPYSLSWLAHPARDEFWKSAAIPIEAIRAPTLLIGGWRELFPEAMMRIFGELRGPKKMIVGPWTHMPPDFSPVEPMDHLQEMLRWWDRWLKDERNGVSDEPSLSYFVQGKNAWASDDRWPPSGTTERSLFLAGGRGLSASVPAGDGGDLYRADPTVGATAGLWELMALGIGRPLDQGPDDLRSLAHTSEPLGEDLEITGSPEAILHVSLEEGEEVRLVAKLCDLSPDGRSSLITTGWLNPTAPGAPAWKAGEVRELRIPLWATAYRIAAGHRLRVSISCSDFPRIFPAPTNATIRLFHGPARPSSIRIPCGSQVDSGAAVPAIRRSDPAGARPHGLIEALPKWKIEHDPLEGSVRVTSGLAERFLLSAGGTVTLDHDATARVCASRPDGAKVEGKTTVRAEMPSGEEVCVETLTWSSQGRAVFRGKVTLDGRLVFEGTWRR